MAEGGVAEGGVGEGSTTIGVSRTRCSMTKSISPCLDKKTFQVVHGKGERRGEEGRGEHYITSSTPDRLYR